METEAKILEVTIPFSGFYESDHSQMLDDAFEQIFWNDQGDVIPYALEEDEEYGNRITTAYFDVDWGKVFRLYAKGYTGNFAHQLNQDLEERGIKISLTFVDLTSPREYNFGTDRIFAKISLEDVQKLLDVVDQEKLSTLIEDRFTDRSGFFSFYPNEIEEWMEKPIEEWDHNEVGTLLQAVVDTYGNPRDYEDYELMEGFRCNGYLDDWIWEGAGPKVQELAEKASAERY